MRKIKKIIQTFFTQHPLGKNLLLLCCMILICAFLVKALTSGESLSEYAEKNPEIAYKVGKSDDSGTETSTEIDTANSVTAESVTAESVTAESVKAESESAVETVSDDIESTATSTAGTSYILCDGFTSQPLPADVQTAGDPVSAQPQAGYTVTVVESPVSPDQPILNTVDSIQR